MSAPLVPLPSSLLLCQVEPAPAAMFSPALAPVSPALLASAMLAATAASHPTCRAAASAAAAWSSQIPGGTKRGRSPDIELVAVSKAADAPPFPIRLLFLLCWFFLSFFLPSVIGASRQRSHACSMLDGLPRHKVSAHASAPGAGTSGTAPTPLPSIDSEPLPLLPKMPYDSVAFDLLVSGGPSGVPGISKTNSVMFWWHQSICVKAQLRALHMQEHWVNHMYLKLLEQALFLTGRTPKRVKWDASVASGSGLALAKGKGKVKAAAAMVEEDASVAIDINDPDAGGPSGESWLGITDASAS
ncbi:hypothetical protein EI94DRAFT_1817592 [Lactarius quietus]|nr:hypothetical protein EI94DRAFT_1817592 [Lactarius quietus]